MSKYCLLISCTRFNNIFCTFCLQRNKECEWFVEMNEALLQYVAINCYQGATVVTHDHQ